MSYCSHREVDLPVLGDSVPVAEILPCDIEGEGLSGAGLDTHLVEVPENADGVVGASKADVKLGDLVTGNIAVVGDVHVDGEQDFVETGVAAEAVVGTSRNTRLRAAVGAAGGPGVVKTVLRVVGGGREVGAVQAGVDVCKDKLEALGAEVVSSPVTDSAVSGSRRGLASSGLVRSRVTSSDLQVAVGEAGV
jgi:hypothetical protein